MCTCMHAYIHISGGLFNGLVIAEGNGLNELSSNPLWGCLHFTLCLCPKERHESVSTLC